jgi:hypothetical protein
MKFNEAFNELTKGKAIRLSCGTVEYPPLMDVCFLLENHNKIIDSNGYDVTFNILQCSMDDTLEWEVYEPTKEELLFEIIRLKQDAYLKTPNHLSSLGGGLNALSGKYHIRETR